MFDHVIFRLDLASNILFRYPSLVIQIESKRHLGQKITVFVLIGWILPIFNSLDEFI